MESQNPDDAKQHRPRTGNGHGAGPGAGKGRRARRPQSKKAPLAQLLDALRSAREGDFEVRLPEEFGGGIQDEIAVAFNEMVGMSERLAGELVRVEEVVGRDGRMTERASLGNIDGGWGRCIGSVNALISDLVQPSTEVARVISAVALGDLKQKMALEIEGQPAKGEFLRIGTTVNLMVDQLNSFASEVTRVAREVGTEGKLGGQAEVKGRSGTWKDLTDNVNVLAGNLTSQVRNIAKITTAVANGDLSQKITVDVKGEMLEFKSAVNTMVDQLNSFASEVTRVAREVGTEGKLGGQAEVKGRSGTWKDLTDNVNQLANNLTDQVRNIAKVTTAVANGDLSQKISVEAKGEVLQLKSAVNTMVDQLNSFASEITRVAREVGTEGKLGGQAEVKGRSGAWKDLTDNVNVLAGNLTDQVRNIAKITTAVANGDLSQKITVEVKGEMLEFKSSVNTMVDQLNSFASEVTRVAREVGTEGKLGGQAEVKGRSGTWKGLTDNVNVLAGNLTDQVRNIAKVTTAVANGDLSQKITVDVKGEMLELKNTVNTMVDSLNSFGAEVTRVAREVGTEGKLGGQARVPAAAGTWKDLTDNVNFMASNLTTQVRGIVKVVTAVANGDLSQKLVGVEAKGEIAALAETINNMCDTLGTFADQVTTVAAEVGIEGKLGGQAKVPGALGTWRQLTDNVNQLAGTLTSQFRAISDVATAVTKGDLTRSIDVLAQGEVATLKANVNQMITNLRETTHKNTEQDWLKTNLAKFSAMMQGQKNLQTVGQLIMSQLTPLVSAHHGAFFMMEGDAAGGAALKLLSTYAYRERKQLANRFELGEGLVGQCALEKKSILLTNCPGDYILISSGLGEAAPLNIIVLPVLFEGEVKAVIELASFHPFSPIHQLFLDQLMESVGVVLNMISANMRTEELLLQATESTKELQSQSKELTQQQGELRRTNSALEKQAIELEDKARLLEEQKTKVEGKNREVEGKNREVEQARVSLEEKAEQLTLISKYKSEFLANMSHELRTPLNSLLILAKLLSDNPDRNLSAKQVEYARTIHGSGGDLLSLINEILDLSKVEAGKMQVDPRDVSIHAVADFVERNFRPLADEKRLEFGAVIEKGAPTSLRTDVQRLQQVLKNLLANAVKFTEHGSVELHIAEAKPGTKFSNEALGRGGRVIAFEVADTGIGIAREKQQIIFEAFQQADGSTSRKYGGTGLGLSISREIAKLLGGEIQVESTSGKGSVFTFFLPERYVGVDPTLDRDDHPLSPRHPTAGIEHETLLARSPGEIHGDAGIRPMEDDRATIAEGDRVLLVIEDDVKFARVMVDMARAKGFRVVVATRGDTGLAIANDIQPDAITLDLCLPVIDGWTVLDRLKRNPRTRHIPVHVISIVDRKLRGVTLGAFAYLQKPVDADTLDAALTHIQTFLDRKVKCLLVVEDNEREAAALSALLGAGDDVDVKTVSSAEAALRELERKPYDCLVVDLVLPGQDGFELIEEVKSQERFNDLPIVVHTGKDLSADEEARLKKYCESVIIKTGLSSPERLLDETSLFLYRVIEKLPEGVRKKLELGREDALAVHGKRILIVDDDVRNIFALTSVLEHHGLSVTYAESGQAGIDALLRDPTIDLVLMDIMMPGMDGYETMRAIRKHAAFDALPIVAITAKALPEDRDKCLAAGASDYLPKPVDEAKLLELISLWTATKATRKDG